MDYKEMINEIKDIQITDFCNQRGIKLKGSGVYRRLEEHDSCVINTIKNNFIWNSREENGDIINFTQSYYKVDFKTAIEIISGKNISEISKAEYIPKPKSRPKESLENETQVFKMELDEISEKYSRLFAYLSKTRKISYDTILKFVNKKLISQDTKGNINFKFTDENGKVNFSKKGTTDKSFNYTDIDSDIRGFRYIPQDELKNDEIIKMHIFESPIDLMSYMDISDVTNEKSVLVSMNGLKHNSLLKNIEDFPNLKYLNLCVDNDSAGDKFINHIRELQTVEDEDLLRNVSITRSNPDLKDWNERLKYMDEIKRDAAVIEKPGIRKNIQALKDDKDKELELETKENNKKKSYEHDR